MARTKHFSDSRRGRSRRRFGSNQSAVQQQQETESRDATSAPESNRAVVGGAENAGQPHDGGTRNEEAGETRQRLKHRFRPGTVALREIRKLQKTWNNLIPAAAFIRIVKDMTFFYSREVNRWRAEALVAIQEAAESFVIELFEDANLCAIHAKRVTLSKFGSNAKGHPFSAEDWWKAALVTFMNNYIGVGKIIIVPHQIYRFL